MLSRLCQAACSEEGLGWQPQPQGIAPAPENHSWTNVRFENTVVTFLHQNLHGHKSTFKWPAHLLQAPKRSSLELRVLALQRASCLTALASGINSHFQKRFARWESESEKYWKVKVTKSELLLKSSGGCPGEAAEEEEDRQQWWSPVGWQVFYFAFSWQLDFLSYCFGEL